MQNIHFCAYKIKDVDIFMKAVYVKHQIVNLFPISKIVTIHYFEFDKDFVSSGESHDFWEFVYVDKGEAIVTAGKQELTLKQGEGYFHKPNEFHRLSANSVTAPNIFIVSFVCNAKSMSFFKNKKIKMQQKWKPYITAIIEEGRKTFNIPFNNPSLRSLSLRENAVIGGQQMIRTYLEQFLISVLRSETAEAETKIFPTRETMENHLVSEILNIIEGAVYTQLSITDICKKLSYSKAYLSKIFKAYCGYSMAEYLVLLKIEKAKQLIREKQLNFTQISDMLAFSNPLYFSRVFKRVTGMSPREYLNSVKID